MNRTAAMKKIIFFGIVFLFVTLISTYIYFKFNPRGYIYEFGGFDTENIESLYQYDDQTVIISITSSKVSDALDDDTSYDRGVMITTLNQSYQVIESTIVLDYKNKMHHGFHIESMLVDNQLLMYVNEVSYQNQEIYAPYLFIYDLNTHTYYQKELNYTVKQLLLKGDKLYAVEEIIQNNKHQIKLHTISNEFEIESTYLIEVKSAYYVSDLIIQEEHVYFSHMDDHGHHTLKRIDLTNSLEETLLENIDLQNIIEFQNDIYVMVHDQKTIIKKISIDTIETISQFEGFYDRFLVTKNDLILGEIGTITQDYLLKYAFVFDGKTSYLYRNGQETSFKNLYALEHETIIVVEFSRFAFFNHFKGGQSALWFTNQLDD